MKRVCIIFAALAVAILLYSWIASGGQYPRIVK